VQIHIPGRRQASDVSVKVYTVAFRLVREQPSQNVPAGRDVTVELKDKTGKPLASGLYYVVVTVDGNTLTAKMMVLW
jgi:hypothetical protein